MAFKKYLSASVFCPWGRRLNTASLLLQLLLKTTLYKNTTLSLKTKIPMHIQDLVSLPNHRTTSKINPNTQTWTTNVILSILSKYTVTLWHVGADRAKADSLHTFIWANNTSTASPQVASVCGLTAVEQDGRCGWKWSRKLEKRGEERNWKTRMSIGIFGWTHMHMYTGASHTHTEVCMCG